MFEWDAGKEAINLKKHGVSFDEAGTAFMDPLGLDGVDIGHSSIEPRRLRLARATSGKILIIAYTMRRQQN
ncbi:MAG: BrnT family toxin [Nitrospirota bacterium]